MTAVLQIDDLFMRFGEQQVLNGFSLQVARGEVVGLLGPNGCGKTTILNIICQLIQADAGKVHLAGKPMSEKSTHARKHIGYCPQQSAVYPDLFPQENIQFFARLYGVPATQRNARVAELMERFSLIPYAATRAGLLSGGWQQRLSLAVALVHSPELLVLDEPTVAVDVEARMDLWRLIEGLRDSGTTILLTSHQLAEAQRLCNRVALMRNGKVVAEGSVNELISRVPGQAVVKVQSEDNQAVIQRASSLRWPVRQNAGKISLLLPYHLSLREIVDALDGTKVRAASVDPVTLEDAYLELVGDSSWLGQS